MSRSRIILILIVLLAAILRFWGLDGFPVHLGHDEVSQLYDAISVAQTGKDIYGNFMPFIFPSVNDFKAPYYTYATVIAYYLFGGDEVVVRYPAAMVGVLMVIAIYTFVQLLFKDRRVGLIAAFFTAVAPFEIFYSRKSFENGAGIFLMILGFSGLFHYLDNKKRFWLVIGTLLLGLAMYTYFSHAVIIPLLVGAFSLIFQKQIFSRKDIKGVAIAGVSLFLLVTPLLIVSLVNPNTRNRSSAVFIFNDQELGAQLKLIKGDVWGELNKLKFIGEYIGDRYLDQFNPKIIFADGLDLTNQAIDIGPMMLVLAPFLAVGLFTLFKNEKHGIRYFIIAWILIGMIPSGLTFEGTSPHRVIMVFTMLNILSALGVSRFFRYIRRVAVNSVYVSAITLFGIVLVINLVYFGHLYTVNYAFEKSMYLHYPFKQVALYAWSKYDEYDRIIFDPKFGEDFPMIGTAAHYYFAYYGKIAPEVMQSQYRLGERSREVLFDKFSIRAVDWREDRFLKNSLVILSPWSLPLEDAKEGEVVQKFNFYGGKLAFYAISLK